MGNKGVQIHFHFQKVITLNKRRLLKAFLYNKLIDAGRTTAEINYIFCSDEELLEINRTHLNHDYFTDIITFDLSDSANQLLCSDIFISADRVKDNANTLEITLEAELHRVIFHGILHLLGYKDKTKQQRGAMREMEDQWLNDFSQFQISKNK